MIAPVVVIGIWITCTALWYKSAFIEMQNVSQSCRGPGWFQAAAPLTSGTQSKMTYRDSEHTLVQGNFAENWNGDSMMKLKWEGLYK